jgi:glycosyltransferase involved in cell wall biosynthesis
LKAKGNDSDDIAVDSTGQGEEKPVVYFIGKLLWEKGLDRLLRLEYFYKEVTGEFFPIDIIGDGPDVNDIVSAYKGEASKTIRKINIESVLEVPKFMLMQTGRVPGRFHGRQDHANFCSEYKVLVNPSVTEVLCTTTAEALAMGKFVIIPKHPSNDFFLQFPNCRKWSR